MKRSLSIGAIGLAALVLHYSQQESRAQQKLVLVFIGTVATATWGAIKHAQAQGAPPQPSVPPQTLGAGSRPSAPTPTLVGKVYRLGQDSWAVTSAEYCVSYVPGLCSPCDYDGNQCTGHFGEQLIKFAAH